MSHMKRRRSSSSRRSSQSLHKRACLRSFMENDAPVETPRSLLMQVARNSMLKRSVDSHLFHLKFMSWFAYAHNCIKMYCWTNYVYSSVGDMQKLFQLSSWNNFHSRKWVFKFSCWTTSRLFIWHAVSVSCFLTLEGSGIGWNVSSLRPTFSSVKMGETSDPNQAKILAGAGLGQVCKNGWNAVEFWYSLSQYAWMNIRKVSVDTFKKSELKNQRLTSLYVCCVA